MSKEIKRICKNCKLFSPKSSECAVIILLDGERHRIPVNSQDPCFFEGKFFDPTTKTIEDFASDIQEVKLWVEDENGEKSLDGKGVVKIEYPEEGFFPS